MFSLSDFEPWWRFGFALLIGALIGLEREFYQQKEESPDFAGIRTFSLIALLGSVSSFLTNDFGIEEVQNAVDPIPATGAENGFDIRILEHHHQVICPIFILSR